MAQSESSIGQSVIKWAVVVTILRQQPGPLSSQVVVLPEALVALGLQLTQLVLQRATLLLQVALEERVRAQNKHQHGDDIHRDLHSCQAGKDGYNSTLMNSFEQDRGG